LSFFRGQVDSKTNWGLHRICQTLAIFCLRNWVYRSFSTIAIMNCERQMSAGLDGLSDVRVPDSACPPGIPGQNVDPDAQSYGHAPQSNQENVLLASFNPDGEICLEIRLSGQLFLAPMKPHPRFSDGAPRSTR
jgi:hypothetical protein